MHHATFQNCHESVIEFLESAQRTLLVGVCWFTHPLIFQALQSACVRNVKVMLVLNYDNINFQPRGLDFNSLEKAGAVVMAYSGKGLLHYKFAVADGCRLLSGSYNWTRAAQRDYVAIVYDNALAAQFTRAFEAIAISCKPLAQLRNTPPRRASFSQLYYPTLWSIQDLRRSVVSGAKTWFVLTQTEQEWRNWIYHQRHQLLLKNISTQWPCNDLLDTVAFLNWFLGTMLRPSTKTLLQRYGLKVRIGDIFVAQGLNGELLGAGIVGSEIEIRAEMPTVASRFVQWLELKTPILETHGKPRASNSGIKRYTGSALALMAKLEANI